MKNIISLFLVLNILNLQAAAKPKPSKGGTGTLKIVADFWVDVAKQTVTVRYRKANLQIKESDGKVVGEETDSIAKPGAGKQVQLSVAQTIEYASIKSAVLKQAAAQSITGQEQGFYDDKGTVHL